VQELQNEAVGQSQCFRRPSKRVSAQDQFVMMPIFLRTFSQAQMRELFQHKEEWSLPWEENDILEMYRRWELQKSL